RRPRMRSVRRLQASPARFRGSGPQGPRRVLADGPGERRPPHERPRSRVMSGRRYTVKEIFYTLQGEGANTGRAAVFCRFSGCNLWTGREEDRATATCTFCDTDFVGAGPDGGHFASAEELADAVSSRWPREAR